MTKQQTTINAPLRAHNHGQVTAMIESLLDPQKTTRFLEDPRPRAVPTMPTFPSRDVRTNPLSYNALNGAYA